MANVTLTVTLLDIEAQALAIAVAPSRVLVRSDSSTPIRVGSIIGRPMRPKNPEVDGT
jgi:hypothetical protein